MAAAKVGGVSERAILVTGASRGIGRAIARAFAEQGDRVAIHHRDSAALAARALAALAGGGHAVVQADLTDPQAARRMVDQACAELGGLDVDGDDRMRGDEGSALFRRGSDCSVDPLVDVDERAQAHGTRMRSDRRIAMVVGELESGHDEQIEDIAGTLRDRLHQRHDKFSDR